MQFKLYLTDKLLRPSTPATNPYQNEPANVNRGPPPLPLSKSQEVIPGTSDMYIEGY